MAARLPGASLLENVQFNQAVIVPNAVQGLFRRRPGPVAVATRLGIDGQAVGLLARLRRNHGPGPLWVRVMASRALLLLSVDDIRRALEGSPDPFASDPEAKRKGMGHFQPDALTLSRGELWQNRRRFTDSVLDASQPAHRLGDRFAAVAAEEVGALLDEIDRETRAELGYEALHQTFRRIVRRVVLGDAARSDELISELLAELMSEANGLPSERSARYEPFMRRVREYVEAAQDGSLVGLFADAPHDPDTRVDGQVVHWLFALQDTLAANVLRALALIAAHPSARERVEAELSNADLGSVADLVGLAFLRGCVQDAMRLYPTTPLLSRETLAELSWNGAVVPAGTQVLIVNVFHHRDRERIDYADRFAPEEWVDGQAGSDWGFNHFSHGPQGCPGVNLALLIGSAVLGQLMRRDIALLEPRLDPARRLPYMLDYFRIRVALPARVSAAAAPA
jgi:cytochrome P450